MDENIEDLRDELSRLHGPARVPKLVRLGQELTRRYWRTGPGRPATLGDLSAAVEAWDEVYGLLDPGDPARAEVAVHLGWLLSVRHGAHGSGPEDRDTGIAVLGEALTFSNIPPMHATMVRLSLGQLFLTRATEALSPAAARGGFLGGLAGGASTDADAAIRLFNEILDGHPLSADTTSMTRTLLTLAESIRPLLSGDVARFDIGKIMQVLSVLQQLQQSGKPSLHWIPGDPLDYPVTVLQGDPHYSPTIPPRRPTFAAPAPTPQYSSRRSARDRLAALVTEPELPAWEQVRRLLLADPSQMAARDLDALVATAVNAVDADEDDEDDGPLESGLDRLLAAVALCLREKRDGTGWEMDDEDATGGAYLAAADQLSAATTRVPPEHAAGIVVVEAIAGLLNNCRPLSGAITGIADSLLEYAEEIPSRPPVVTALAELCRTVIAVRAGTAPDTDIFAAALAAAPADHRARHALSRALAHARLVVAVRAGGPIAVDPTLGDLAALLGALLDDDKAALHTALDAAEATSPKVSAVLGAIRLRLADDTGAAIALLSSAVHLLDDDGLCTRTRWQIGRAHV